MTAFNFEQARFNMIEQQIRPWEVLDPAVLSLLSTVRREEFVPPALKALAFVDTQIPLLDGPDAPRMLEPRVEARMLQELQVQRHEKALEIGTGSGFMAALLAHRAQRVITLECRPALAARARDALQRAGLVNASVREVSPEQGARGLAEEGPYDVIVLSGSVTDVPRALLEQLSVGGRLAAIVGEEPVMRARLYTRSAPEAWTSRDVFDTLAPALEGFGVPHRFVF